MLVVDASVIIKIFADEQGSSAADALLGRYDRKLIAAHGYAEVCEALTRKARSGEISRQQLKLMVPLLLRGSVSVPLDELIEPALNISMNTGASVYDSLYIALASSENCQLVTADRA